MATLWFGLKFSGYSPMAYKAYLVKFKPPALGAVQTVIASTVEVHDEHLIFCDSKGRLAALFLLEMVESWSELPDAGLVPHAL